MLNDSGILVIARRGKSVGSMGGVGCSGCLKQWVIAADREDCGE